jgi:YVTN family beta-propeller protein
VFLTVGLLIFASLGVLALDSVTDRGVPATSSGYHPEVIHTSPLAGKHATVIPEGVPVKSIPVGSFPWEASLDSQNGELFVVNENSSNVSVISAATNSVVANVPVGLYPEYAVYDPVQAETFVTNMEINDLSWDGSVSVISDTTNKLVTTIPTQFGAVGIAYDGAQGEFFVVCYNYTGPNYVDVISAATNHVLDSIDIGSSTRSINIVYDSGAGEVFVGNYASDYVTVISTATDKIVAKVAVGLNPYGLVYDSDAGEVFVGNSNSSTVSVISDSSNTVVATVPVGTGPISLDYEQDQGEVFVTNQGSSSVSVISDSTNSVVATIPVGSAPIGIDEDVSYDPVQGQTFVANALSGNVSVISDETDKVVTTFSVGTEPTTVLYDGSAGEMFVLNGDSNNVSVLPAGAWSLSSVAISPSSVRTGSSGNLSAQPVCKGVDCDSVGVPEYAWSLTNNLGTLNSTTGPVVAFTAGKIVGIDTLFVNVTLNGVTVQQSVPIMIVSSTGGPPPAESFPMLITAVVVLVGVLLIAVVVVVLTRPPRSPTTHASPPPVGPLSSYDRYRQKDTMHPSPAKPQPQGPPEDIVSDMV